jgi:hypothetical protein
MPYLINFLNGKYELRLKKTNKLLGTHETKKDAEKQIQAIELSKGRKDADLYIKAHEIADEKYGLPHSARKQQQITRIYKELGGRYTSDDLKPNQKSLQVWTMQDWRTKSGLPSSITGERYLPRSIIMKLTDKEYDATSKAKKEGMAKGVQYVKQPKKIIEKIKKIKN